MEYFDTLDALTDDAKQHFQMLIKFGKKSDLEKLQQGSFYMKNLKYYNELEGSATSGKPDEHDGKWAVQDVSFTFSNPDTHEVIATGTAPRAVLAFGIDKCPVFCLFSYDYRNCVDATAHDADDVCNIKTTFTEEQREKLVVGLGEYALLISDTEGFLQRVVDALKGNGIEYRVCRIAYNQGNSVDRVNSIMSDTMNIAFNKDADRFAYQQELRILITNHPVDDHLEIDIGNIENITNLIPTKDLLALRIEINQHFYRQE